MKPAPTTKPDAGSDKKPDEAPEKETDEANPDNKTGRSQL